MSDDAPQPVSPSNTDGDEDKPPYLIEQARSGRSKCKACKRTIQKDKPRFGLLIEGPFGPGYLWHHLTCAARRRFADVEEAYAMGIGQDVEGLPSIESLKAEQAANEEERAKKKTAPYVEIAPTGRSKCRACEDLIGKASPRGVVLRSVEFYGQTRVGPINVHPRCVQDALAADDNATDTDDFSDAVRRNSEGVEPEVIGQVLAEIGAVD